MSIGRPRVWTLETCKAAAAEYKTRKEFEAGKKGAYGAARANDWLSQCCSHMESGRKVWSKQECIAEALKYQARKKFKDGSAGAYSAASKNGWLHECCSHMKEGNLKLTKESCISLAVEFDSIETFKSSNMRAFSTAKRRGWLSDCESQIMTKDSKLVAPSVIKNFIGNSALSIVRILRYGDGYSFKCDFIDPAEKSLVPYSASKQMLWPMHIDAVTFIKTDLGWQGPIFDQLNRIS